MRIIFFLFVFVLPFFKTQCQRDKPLPQVHCDEDINTPRQVKNYKGV